MRLRQRERKDLPPAYSLLKYSEQLELGYTEARSQNSNLVSHMDTGARGCEASPAAFRVHSKGTQEWKTKAGHSDVICRCPQQCLVAGPNWPPEWVT